MANAKTMRNDSSLKSSFDLAVPVVVAAGGVGQGRDGSDGGGDEPERHCQPAPLGRCM